MSLKPDFFPPANYADFIVNYTHDKYHLMKMLQDDLWKKRLLHHRWRKLPTPINPADYRLASHTMSIQEVLPMMDLCAESMAEWQVNQVQAADEQVSYFTGFNEYLRVLSQSNGLPQDMLKALHPWHAMFASSLSGVAAELEAFRSKLHEYQTAIQDPQIHLLDYDVLLVETYITQRKRAFRILDSANSLMIKLVLYLEYHRRGDLTRWLERDLAGDIRLDSDDDNLEYQG
jgi:hypothetical protein